MNLRNKFCLYCILKRREYVIMRAGSCMLHTRQEAMGWKIGRFCLTDHHSSYFDCLFMVMNIWLVVFIGIIQVGETMNWQVVSELSFIG